MKLHRLAAFAILSFLSFSASAQSVQFTNPQDGAVVSSPFKVGFMVDGMKVMPAGNMTPGTGHHHLLINVDVIPEGQNIPMDEKHKHFGNGQTETELSLPPGKYKLTMLFANGAHQSYGPKMSKTIEITVK